MLPFGSDTQTRPTPGMLAAMAAAEVGDDQRGQDPTTRALEEEVADLLGQEAALFVPSGTMANVIALRLHVGSAGGTAIMDTTAHLYRYEAGALGALCGAVPRLLCGDGGRYTPEQLLDELHPADHDVPPPRVVCVEQTTNIAGGRVWGEAALAGVVRAARAAAVATHLDGARLLNAVVASGREAARHAGPFDSATLCLSKGLGCPAGALLAGSTAFVAQARRQRQMLGGAMRQSGYLAAAGRYALAHHVDRLADDHRRARALAERAGGLPGVRVAPHEVETNIVVLGVDDAPGVQERLAQEGVEVDALDGRRLRVVTHLDVSDADVEHLVRALATAVRGGTALPAGAPRAGR